jgi:hypothetical protein
MQVPGYLRLTTLGDVLGAIYREGATGNLALSEFNGPRAGATHRIHVVSGLVVDVEASFPGTRLGDILMQAGALDPSKLHRCTVHQAARPGARIGDVLLQSRALSEYALSEALRVQRRERLERLFELDDARLGFHVARPRAQREALDPPGYLHGRRRLRDRVVAPARRERAGASSMSGVGGASHSSGARPARTATAERRDPVRARALATLGLNSAADRPSVQRAFRELARTLHPDRFPQAGMEERVELMRRFAEITAAYHTLVA